MGLSRASGRVSSITPECARCTSSEGQKQTAWESKHQGSTRRAKQRAKEAEGRSSDEARRSDRWHTAGAAGKKYVLKIVTGLITQVEGPQVRKRRDATEQASLKSWTNQ